MSARTIVTGGAGFIGSNLVAALNARGVDEILIVDHLGRDEKWKNLRGLVFEDFLDKSEFRQRLRDGRLDRAETVFHLGACSDTTEADSGYLMDNNYRYSRELCLWCLESGARFVYASSGATYGDGTCGYGDDEATTLKLRPLNMYGYSKHAFDLWALKNALFTRIAGLKYFNVYGPREDHKGDMRSVVHKAYEQISASGEVALFKSYRPEYADGEQVRDFIYVADAVAATLHFADRSTPGGLFNVGTGRARSWRDLAEAVFAARGLEPRIRFIEMPESLRSRYQYYTQARVERLREAGFKQPFTSLEDGVAAYVSGHLAKRD